MIFDGAVIPQKCTAALAYGKHTGPRTRVQEPTRGYLGKHSAEAIRGCLLPPDQCSYRCRDCGLHICQCSESIL